MLAGGLWQVWRVWQSVAVWWGRVSVGAEGMASVEWGGRWEGQGWEVG